jgi:hypothetical protein
MKTIATLALILSSCTVATIKNPAGGEATYSALGSDSEGVDITPERIGIASNKNAASFTKAASAATAITGIMSYTN